MKRGIVQVVAVPVGLVWVVTILFFDRWLDPAVSDGSGSARDLEASLAEFNLDRLGVPRRQILSGGPPKDGIPALVDPHVEPVVQARFLEPNDRVLELPDQAEVVHTFWFAWVAFHSQTTLFEGHGVRSGD